MIRKQQSVALFQPIDSSSRLKRVQNLLKSLSLPALVLIAGSDGNSHWGSVRLIHYLLFGFCGRDLENEVLARASSNFSTSNSNREMEFPKGVLHDQSLDEVFMVIKQNSVIIYCTPLNSKFITNITSMWPNTEYLKPSVQDFENDMDSVEHYKVTQFLRLMNELPQKTVAFPLTPNNNHPNGDVMEVEQWPLIQAYALSDFEQGGFFTMKFQIVGIMNHLMTSIFTGIDSQTIKVLASSHLENLKSQWDNTTANLDAYMSNRMEDLEELRAVPEIDLIEPLTSSFAFSSIPPTSPKESHRSGKPPYPRLLLGKRSALDEELSGSWTIASQEEAEGGSISHFVLEASDSQSPIACARTYFLQVGRLPIDPLLTKNTSVTSTKIYNAYNAEQTTLLMEIYSILLENFDYCCKLICEGTQDNWKDLNKESRAFLSAYLSSDTSLSDKARNIVETIEPIVSCTVYDMGAYLYHTGRKPNDLTIRNLEYGIFYLKIEYPFITIESRDMGSLVFGETLAVSKGQTSFPNQILPLTADIPAITCFKADKAEILRTSEIIDSIEQRISKNKLPHPKMQRFLSAIDNVTVSFPVSKFYRHQGEVSFFTHGFTFCNNRYGIFSVSWDAVKEITFHQFSEGDIHFIEFAMKDTFTPYGPLTFYNNRTVLMHFYPGSRIRRQFSTHILSEWKTSCSKARVTVKEVREEKKDSRAESPQQNSTTDTKSNSSELENVIRKLDLEGEALKVKMKHTSKESTKQTLHFFSLSSQTSSEAPILEHMYEFKNIVQSFQLHDSGLSKKEITPDVDVRGIKTIPIHIITGGVRSTMIDFAENLISIAKTEYGLLLVPIGGSAALDPHEEPEYDFKAFITQLIQAIKEGRSADSIDNVHLMYIVPGFTDVERVVRGIQQLKQAKNIPIKISSVNACINKDLLMKDDQVDTEVLPNVLRQCTNGFVVNIFMNPLKKQGEQELEVLLRRASPCAYITYHNFSKPLPLYDAKEVLKGNRFNTSVFVKARTLSSKNVGSDIRATLVKCRPITFDYEKLKSALRDECISARSFYFTGLACAIHENKQKLFSVIGFSSSLVLKELSVSVTEKNFSHVNRFFFYGRRVVEKEFQTHLEEAFIPFPSPKPLLTRPSLTHDDLENIRELYLLDDLPEGWNFDGSMFIDPEGKRVRNHPEFPLQINRYITEKNKEIESFNATIPTTNIELAKE